MKLLLALLLAHSWYDPECCDDRDCRPAKPSEVRIVAEGYQLETELIQFGDKRIRVSKDNRYHICMAVDDIDEVITCLYVPHRGV